MEKMFLRTVFLLSTIASGSVLAWTNSQDAGKMLGASQVTEITFQKSSSTLNAVNKSEIRTAINEASQTGKIAEVKILSWSDKEYPSPEGKQSRDDVKLAKKRISSIKTFLKDEMKVSSVDTYNMTERPNALQKFLHTKGEQVKNTAELAGAAPTNESTGFFDQNAQASKSVIMIFMKK